jgi:uncharacterized membrane protein
MRVIKAAAGGFVAGVAAMYFTDPDRGRRRRVIVRDKVNANWRDVMREFDKAGRDLRNRSQGVASAVRSMTSRAEWDEPVIEERVRSSMGRAVSHPHAISVKVEPDGRVVLEGPVLEHEVPYLLKRVRSVAGVKEVINLLEVHQEPGTLASLQGGRPRGRHSDFARESWTPALRFAAAAAAGAAFYQSASKGGLWRLPCAAIGWGLLLRAVSNRSLAQLFGIRGARAVEIDKTVHIVAPVAEVFAFWSKVENFPRFMAHLKEVRDLGGGKSHWVAAGLAGLSVSWEAEITDSKKDQRLAWRSVPGSLIDTEGVVRFDPTPDGGTRVAIRMAYSPPAGVFGHGVAWLFGADPKTEIDEDLVRLKSLLEIGKTRAHGSTVWREEFELATPGPVPS